MCTCHIYIIVLFIAVLGEKEGGCGEWCKYCAKKQVHCPRALNYLFFLAILAVAHFKVHGKLPI